MVSEPSLTVSLGPSVTHGRFLAVWTLHRHPLHYSLSVPGAMWRPCGGRVALTKFQPSTLPRLQRLVIMSSTHTVFCSLQGFAHAGLVERGAPQPALDAPKPYLLLSWRVGRHSLETITHL